MTDQELALHYLAFASLSHETLSLDPEAQPLSPRMRAPIMWPAVWAMRAVERWGLAITFRGVSTPARR